MAIRIGINGFGRIGRSVYRILGDREDIQIAAINDVTDNATLAYLLQWDTVMGPFKHAVEFHDNEMKAGKQKTRMLNISDPAKIPWKEYGVDIVVEATGRFRAKAEVELHLKGGARKVILTVPPKDALDAMVVIGANDKILKPEHKLVSNASCTTNCLAPVAKVLHENFGIKYGFMTTVHAYTNDQRLSDFYHKDLRRARAANENIIPTTTGAARAVGKILPELAGKLDGVAMRVPVPDGSTVDLVTLLDKTVTAEEVNKAVEKAANNEMKGIIQYNTAPIVSSDIIGNSHSSIFDAPFTKVLQGNFVKTVAWYDNEWGYSCRVVDLVKLLSQWL